MTNTQLEASSRGRRPTSNPGQLNFTELPVIDAGAYSEGLGLGAMDVWLPKSIFKFQTSSKAQPSGASGFKLASRGELEKPPPPMATRGQSRPRVDQSPRSVLALD